MSGAPEKRQAVRELTVAGVSARRACAILGTSRSWLSYEPAPRDDEALIAAINKIRRKKKRWGYKRVHARLRREGFNVNRKRVERIWREQGFTLPARRPRKKVRTGESLPVKAEYSNHVWTYDFVFDATAGGRTLKVLSVVDEFTRVALAVVPGRSMTASVVKKVLTGLFADHGTPGVIRSDNGPEFIAAEIVVMMSSCGVCPSRDDAARAGAISRLTVAERLWRVVQRPAS